MKSARKMLSIVLALVLVFIMAPVQSQAATYRTLPKDDDGFYNFDYGNDYKLTLKQGQDTTIFSEYLLYDIDDVESSNPSVVKVTETASSYFDIVAKQDGTAIISIMGYDEDSDEYDFTDIKVTVKANPAIEVSNWVYKSTTKVKVKAKYVKKGDTIKLKIGKKTYTKKVTKTAASLKTTIKIKKPNFYGKKYTITLNRKGKAVASEKQYIFISKYVHVGDTKKKVKWLTGWNDPIKKNKSAYSEQWCYDWDEDGHNDAYLYFNNKGKVTNWQIFE